MNKPSSSVTHSISGQNPTCVSWWKKMNFHAIQSHFKFMMPTPGDTYSCRLHHSAFLCSILPISFDLSFQSSNASSPLAAHPHQQKTRFPCVSWRKAKPRKGNFPVLTTMSAPSLLHQTLLWVLLTGPGPQLRQLLPGALSSVPSRSLRPLLWQFSPSGFLFQAGCARPAQEAPPHFLSFCPISPSPLQHDLSALCLHSLSLSHPKSTVVRHVLSQ